MPKATPSTDPSIADFLAAIPDEQQRADAIELDRVFTRATGAPGKMWGKAIVGYGSSIVEYAGGRTEQWMAIGFSPRSKKIVIYGTGAVESRDGLLAKLGKHSLGKDCLNVAQLADVDLHVLEELARRANR